MSASDALIAGTAATALAVSCVPGAITVTGRDSPTSRRPTRRSGPSSVPGSIRSGRIDRGSPRPRQSSSDQVPVRGSSSWVVEASVRSPARRPVRSQPKRSGIISSVSATSSSGEFARLQRQELIDRVERQELQAGDLVDPLARDEPERGLDHAVGPGVAVVDRVAQQGVARGRPGRSRRPRYRRRRRRARRRSRGRLAQGRLDLVEEPGEVPVERVEHPDRPVGEPVDLLQGEPLAVEPAQQPPAALGPQVQGQVVGRRCHVSCFAPSPQGGLACAPRSSEWNLDERQ